MTSPSDQAAALKVVNEVARIARTGEALLSLSRLLVATSESVLHVQKVDDSPDLGPELSQALDHLHAAAECVKSAAAVVDARFHNAIEEAN